MSTTPPNPTNSTSNPLNSSAHHQQPPRQIPRHSERRTRPRLTEQIQVIRELWLLREQARVQAAERCFLTELERLLSGGPYATLSVRVPPPPFSTTSSTSTTTSTSTATTSLAPNPPPLPSFPISPTSIPHQYSAQTSVPLYVDDEFVFESHPPPRGDQAPVREMPGSVSREMEEARASQRVTNLSAEFRARLEGNDDRLSHELQDQSPNEELSYQGAVTSVLDSQFRHRLERVLHQRSTNSYQMRHLYRTGSYNNVNGEGNDDDHHNARMRQNSENLNTSDNDSNRRTDVLEPIIAALREEVNVLRNVVNASFDIQLDIQRSIRQEVAAAMSTPAVLSLNNLKQPPAKCKDGSGGASSMVDDVTSACSNEASSSNSTRYAQSVEQQQLQQQQSSNQALILNNMNNNNNSQIGSMKAGLCVVCLEGSIDVLLYACGHMCTCAACGRQLLASGLPCPICRAPVRDVVRAFVVTE